MEWEGNSFPPSEPSWTAAVSLISGVEPVERREIRRSSLFVRGIAASEWSVTSQRERSEGQDSPGSHLIFLSKYILRVYQLYVYFVAVIACL
jgi:hypothetical protein